MLGSLNVTNWFSIEQLVFEGVHITITTKHFLIAELVWRLRQHVYAFSQTQSLPQPIDYLSEVNDHQSASFDLLELYVV